MTAEPFESGPLLEVERLQGGSDLLLQLVRRFEHSRERVWKVLTDPALLRAWSPYVADRDLSSPGPVALQMIDGMSDAVLATEVRRAERPVLLEYGWGDSDMAWRLDVEGPGTRLTLRQSVADEAMLPKLAAGWHICLAVADRLLQGRPVGPIVGESSMDHGWQALHDAYAARLDPG